MKRKPHERHARGVGGTQETVSKLRIDVIDRLFKAGKIRPEQKTAAEEICMVWEALQRGFFPSSSWIDTPIRLTGGFRNPMERMTPLEKRLLKHRYRPWSRRESPKRVEMVIDCICDNYGLRELERRHGMKRGSAIGQLQISLHEYCLLSGSVSRIA